MDLDKSLDDLIPKRKPRSSGGADRKPRQSRDRRDAVPYSRPPPRSTEDKWVHDAYSGPDRERGDRGDRRDRQPRRDAGVAFVSASPRIEVSGIHYEVTTDDLKSIFSQAGTIVQGPTIRYDRSGRSTGVAIIEYASEQQAKLALNQFDGAMTKGQTISIKLIAPPRPPVQKKDSSKSLMQRLGGVETDLSSRIGGARGGRDAKPNPRKDTQRGQERTRSGRGGPPRQPREPRKRGPANADDLDKELDGFMKPDAGGDVTMA